MMNAVQDQDLSPAQVKQLTNAMLSVAMVDGLNPAEAALIRQFYDSARSDDMLPTDAVMDDQAAHQFNLGELAGSSPEFADTLVLMSLMTAYADGSLSQGERELVDSIAGATGMDGERLAKHLAQVQNDLIGALSHLPDSGSVANVLRELS